MSADEERWRLSATGNDTEACGQSPQQPCRTFPFLWQRITDAHPAPEESGSPSASLVDSIWEGLKDDDFLRVHMHEEAVARLWAQENETVTSELEALWEDVKAEVTSGEGRAWKQVRMRALLTGAVERVLEETVRILNETRVTVETTLQSLHPKLEVLSWKLARDLCEHALKKKNVHITTDTEVEMVGSALTCPGTQLCSVRITPSTPAAVIHVRLANTTVRRLALSIEGCFTTVDVEGSSLLSSSLVRPVDQACQLLGPTSAEVRISRCVFQGVVESFALHVTSVPNVTLTSTRLHAVRALDLYGASVYSVNSHLHIHNCSFQNDSTPERVSRAILTYVSNLTVTHSVFTGLRPLSATLVHRNYNHLSIERFPETLRRGAVLSNEESRVRVENCKMEDNGGTIMDAEIEIMKRRKKRQVGFNGDKETDLAMTPRAVVCHVGDHVVIHNCAFERNTGGALGSVRAPLNLSDSVFQDNNADYGGALYLLPASTNISGSTFARNGARISGGALNVLFGNYFSFWSNVSVSSCIFDGNTAGSVGGVFVMGRALRVASGIAVFSNCSMLNNHAGTAGVGTMITAIPSRFIFTDCTFHHNSAREDVGVLRVLTVNVTLQRCDFFNNSAAETAGVLQVTPLDPWPRSDEPLYSSQTWIHSCTFRQNRARKGGVIVVDTTSGTPGPPVALRLTNCSLVDNFASMDGGVLLLDETGRTSTTNILLDESVLANNRASRNAGVLLATGSRVSMNNCTATNNSAAFSAGVASLTYHSTLEARDTLFEDNSCTLDGGAIQAYFNSSIDLRNVTFLSNTAERSSGGAVSMETSCSMTSRRCAFSGNQATTGGGAVFVEDHSCYNDTGSTFSNNVASDKGGRGRIRPGGI